MFMLFSPYRRAGIALYQVLGKLPGLIPELLQYALFNVKVLLYKPRYG